MSSFRLLDCTLRDGGYINNFAFGKENIDTIIDNLCEANIEIIECGFLRTGKDNPECSLYGDVAQICLPKTCGDKMFVAMIEFGGIDIEDIVQQSSGLIDGIRLTFHNSEWEETKEFAQQLMTKGYKIFIQPVGTLSYTDEELLKLIKDVNLMNPFAFYLVDTLGSMYKNDLLRLYYLIDNNLSKDIALGFHSHNNMQLSFSNAMTLLELHIKRPLIIDSSIFGMGRGAGNLNTELITHFINTNIGMRYKTTPILEVIDDIILPIYKDKPWGFSEPYYMAAIRGCHPNYVTYLIDKQSMSMTQIGELLDSLPREERHLYKKEIIESLYLTKMERRIDDTAALEYIQSKINNRELLILVPGNSIKTAEAVIKAFIELHNPFVITVNFVPEQFVPDLVFVGNQKRYAQLKHGTFDVAATSNIKGENIIEIDYDSLLTEHSDSSGLMVLQLAKRLKINKVYLAGYDGFSSHMNYYGKKYDNYLSVDAIEDLNRVMIDKLNILKKEMELIFITPTVYDI